MTRCGLRLALLALPLVASACTVGREKVEWAHDDPERPLMVAVAPSEAERLEAAARACGLTNLQRIVRSDLAWIVVRDVLASDSENSLPARCLRDWAMNHPEIRVFYIGRAEPSGAE